MLRRKRLPQSPLRSLWKSSSETNAKQRAFKIREQPSGVSNARAIISTAFNAKSAVGVAARRRVGNPCCPPRLRSARLRRANPGFLGKRNRRQQSGEVPQALHLLVGRSLVITSPSRIKRVSLADPAIAEAIVVSPTQVLVNGKAPGGVSLIIWDENEQSQAFEVSVDIDVLSLTEKIHEVFPNEPVVVETSKDVVMLSGKISSQAVADKILEVVKGTTPKVTSLMEVPASPPGEILLEVKFAEVDKTALQELGIKS